MPRPRRRLILFRSFVLLATLVPLLAGRDPFRAARADEKWGQPYKDLLSIEVRTLLPLMRGAVKSDYRRQAWYVANRIVSVEAGQSEAAGVVKRWSEAELQQGQAPDVAWAKQRDATLKGLGDKYFHFGETLNAKGLNPVDYWVIIERALAYGSTIGVPAIEQDGYAWMGTWGSQEKKGVYNKIGTLLEAVTFSPEFDDEYLKMRARWADAKVARFRGWRLYTDLKPEEAMHAVYVLATEENHIARTLGTATREDETITDLFLFSGVDAYERIGAGLVRDADREKFRGTSGWHDRWTKRLLVAARHHDNPWIGDDAVLLGFAAPVLLRRHSAAGGSVQGRGAWLFEGVSGAYEGFKPPPLGAEGGEIVPARCWRLAAAKVLRERVDLLPWDQLLETDQAAADALPKKVVKMRFASDAREAVNVNVVACQATAFVVGLLLADGGKGAAKLSKLIEDLSKRDRLPELSKSIGWTNAHAFDEANKAMDAVGGK